MNSPKIAATENQPEVAEPAQQNDAQQESADEAAANPSDGSSRQQSTANASATPAQSSQESKENDAESQQIAEGQTLWSLAEDNYGNPRLWPWIYGNNDALENPDEILAGSSLSVPLPSGPQNQLNATDSVGVAKGFYCHLSVV
ncbi:MAG: hypothetical protein U5J63_09890 [Fodinibius sp.]|nr:hypothetical protein [Fodinibius sp.]